MIKTNHVKFYKAVYYSPSTRQTYTAKVPDGYEGEFGPGIKSLVFNMSHDTLVSQPALKRLFNTFGISISGNTISRMLIHGDNINHFHQEKDDIVDVGLHASTYQHTDDTTSKVNGINHYTHIVCNDFYTAYFTLPKKNRFTVLNILCQGELHFIINDEAYKIMEALNLPPKWIIELKKHQGQTEYSKKALNHLIRKLFPNPKKHKAYKRMITEAAAIAGCHEKKPFLKMLVCDDAPQFKHLLEIALCWIHEGRHYKKLNPIISTHKDILQVFLTKFWDYYRELLAYKQSPCEEKEKTLEKKFIALFSSVTGYKQLDERIAKTLNKKDSLLLVLKHPELPVHNNPPELGARSQKRKGDVSLQTKNKKGTKAKDTMMTIVQTAIKLKVNTYDYIYDRITKVFKMTSLAELIKIKSGTGVVVGGLP